MLSYRYFSRLYKIKFFYPIQSFSKFISFIPTGCDTDMRLITDNKNLFALKIYASFYTTNIPFEKEIVNKKDFKFPQGVPHQLPLLEVEPKRYLTSGNAVTRFLFNSKYGRDTLQVEELLEWESTKLQPLVMNILHSNVCKAKQDEILENTLCQKILPTLDNLLENKSFLTSNEISAADIAIWSTLYTVTHLDSINEKIGNLGKLKLWLDKLSSMSTLERAVKDTTDNHLIDTIKIFFEHTPLAQFRNLHISKGENSKSNSEEIASEGPSKQDVEAAKEYWLKGRSCVEKPRDYKHPILPKKNEKNILITAALPYVNNVPHLGNIIGCILSADVYARYCRLRNYNCLYICGTDEYGTATETKAIAEGSTPQEICDKYNALHTSIYKWFNIGFDYFGRTTTSQQTTITQDIFWKIHKNGYLKEDTVEQLQCTSCNRFLADRFVEGICPLCKYEDARGDQCDACGKLINAVELIKPRCSQCGSTPIVKSSRHVFLDLPKIESNLKSWLKNSEEANWTHNAKNITKAWIADGLRPRCITRDLKWGTPVPLEGFTDKVFYVWFDAPIGYLSITANYTDQWEQWWKNPEHVTLVQFMAKDNVPFHTVVFPSSLLAADDNYTILNEISATEYLNYEEDKFSKSRGVGVFGDQAESTGIPADIFRFYLLYVRPESQDSAFQWNDMILKNNSELLNNLGNFVNRALMFLKNSFNSTIPELDLHEEEYELIASINNDLSQYICHLEKQRLRDGLRYILNISRSGNQYIQSNKPWVLVKGNDTEKSRAGTVIGLSANISALLAILIKPYMPLVSDQLKEQLKLQNDRVVISDHFVPMLDSGHQIGNPYPLFNKLDPAVADELKKRFAGVKKTEPLDKKKDSTKESSPTVNNVVVDPVKVAEIEAKVSQQGEVVRKLKTEKAPKEEIDAEVLKLLELKKQLTIAQGKNPDDKSKGGKKNKKGKKK